MGRKYQGGLEASLERRKEKIAEYQKKYYQEHREACIKSATKRQKEKKQEYLAYQKEYYHKNNVKIQARRKERLKNKLLDSNGVNECD